MDRFMVRMAVPRDLAQMAALDARVQRLPWSLSALSQEMGSRFSRIWVVFPLNSHHTVAGFLLFRMVMDEIYVVQFSIDIPWQRRGAGKMAMNLLIRYGQRCGSERIVLDVSPDNDGAIGFYTSFGFMIQGGETKRVQGRRNLIMDLSLR